jgi:hypothetical protein
MNDISDRTDGHRENPEFLRYDILDGIPVTSTQRAFRAKIKKEPTRRLAQCHVSRWFIAWL